MQQKFLEAPGSQEYWWKQAPYSAPKREYAFQVIHAFDTTGID